MRTLRLIWLFFLPVLLLAGCDRIPVFPEELEQPELGLYIEIPGPMATKADEGEIPSKWAAEYAIKTLQLWIFESAVNNEGKHDLVKYIPLTQAQFPVEGNVRYYSFPVDSDFAHNRPDVDVFVVANAASIGLKDEDLGDETSWEELELLKFGGSNFGPDQDLVVTPSLPNGLPMSGVGKNLKLEGSAPVLMVEKTVQLTRAVSKMRFVFCKTMNEAGSEANVTVNSIQVNGVNGYMVPNEEYVFPAGDTPWHFPATYSDQGLSFSFSPALQPVQNKDPQSLVYNNQDPVAYEQLLDNAVAAGELSDCGVVYLRETDQLLQVSLSYTIDDTPKPAIFTMQAPPEGPYQPGDFARNHSWTVYGYFLSDRNIKLTSTVLPWTYKEETLVNTDDAISVDSTNPFTIEPPHEATWVSSNEKGGDNYNVYVASGETVVVKVAIEAPKGGKLVVQAKGSAGSFDVYPKSEDITGDPITITVSPKAGVSYNPDVETFVTLSFTVEHHDRETDINTEVFNKDVYRFYLTE
ncbi:MAG: hypothetical protein II454_06100 [Bacteroidales bacterium]|nr:hypothetical protein [Bacteroidales bacterium]